MKIYLVPFLLDFILFAVQSRLGDAAGREMHLSNAQATSLLVAFNVAYMIACPVAARVLDARTTKPILLCSLGALLFLAVPLVFMVSFWPVFFFIGGLGLTAAFAFNAFQAFMRGRSAEGAMASTVAKYNVSWSLGIGLGFLLTGVLRSYGQPLILAALCSAAIIGLIGMIAGDKPAPVEEGDKSSTRIAPETANTRHANARYVAIGWSLCVAGNFLQRPLVTFISKFSAQAGHQAWMAGTLLCVLMWAQALGGYISYRQARWHYTARPLIVLQIGIVLALCGLWLSQSYALSLVSMAILGVLQGFTFFCAVFYTSNSSRSAHNVGINEMMVGVGNIGGMVVCNAAIRWMNNDLAFYPVIIAFSLLLLVAQMTWLRTVRVSSAKETCAAV